MPNDYFSFKQFTIWQDKTAMKVTTDACLFGAWTSEIIRQEQFKNLAIPPALSDDTPKPSRIADIGTGTAILSLMIHQKNPMVLLEALEIDSPAAEQARQNVLKANADGFIQIYTVDANDFSPMAPYDHIVSNPPFYKDDLKARMANRNQAFHEETLSLLQLFTFIEKNLTAFGAFYLMLPFRREQEAVALALTHQLAITEKIIVRTSLQHPPHRVLLRGRRKENTTNQTTAPSITKEITILQKDGTYDSAFIGLLKDYYLSL